MTDDDFAVYPLVFSDVSIAAAFVECRTAPYTPTVPLYYTLGSVLIIIRVRWAYLLLPETMLRLGLLWCVCLLCICLLCCYAIQIL